MWPSWATFEAKLEEEYGDPAAESQAQEFLLTYKQGKKKPREFLNELELWFHLANVTEDGHKLRAATRAMDPSMVESLTIAGYPESYEELRNKLLSIDDAKRKHAAIAGSSLDSRLRDSGLTHAFQATNPRFANYRAQGHGSPNTPKRLSVSDILKMPIGQRPKPKSPCWTCRDLNRGDAFHWRDECPYKREQAAGRSYPNPQRTPQVSRPAQARPPQEPRRLPPLGPAIARPKGPRQNPRFNRQVQEGEPNAMASVSALLASMSENDRHSILVEEAKRLAL